MVYNKIHVKFCGVSKITGPAINYQFDQKQILVIEGLELPEYYEVDFCNEGDRESITIIGTAEGIEIPDQFLLNGKRVKAYLVLFGEEEGAVETRYEITLPVNRRPQRTDIDPTPTEQRQIDSLISRMNDAAEKSESYAVGHTGTRQGEDTDNAKFYSEVAGQYAGSAGWVYFYIDDNGYLHYVKTANCDLDFYIDDNGQLHVTNGEA